MKEDVAYDFAFAQKYDAEVRSIIGALLVVPATIEQDRRFATDAMIYKIKHGPRAGKPVESFAERIRRPGYFWQRSFKQRSFWGEQFTIRSWRDSGAETEESKFIKGFCDWMFYGHIEQDLLRHWVVLDLAIYRAFKDRSSYEDQDNRDGTYFRAYTIASFPRQIVIGASETMKIVIERGVKAVQRLPSRDQARIIEPPPSLHDWTDKSGTVHQGWISRYGNYSSIDWKCWDDEAAAWKLKYASDRLALTRDMGESDEAWVRRQNAATQSNS